MEGVITASNPFPSVQKFTIRFSEPQPGPPGERSIALLCESDARLAEAIETTTKVLGIEPFKFPPVITLALAPESSSDELV